MLVFVEQLCVSYMFVTVITFIMLKKIVLQPKLYSGLFL